MKKSRAKYLDLILKILPYITDLGQLVGRRDASSEVLSDMVEDVREEISTMHEHMDRMYLSLRKEISDIRLLIYILMGLNLLLLVLAILLLIKVW